jgi:hypothetical protein
VQYKKTFSARKIWKEIDKPPYAALKNLKSLTEQLPKEKTAVDAAPRAKEAVEYLVNLKKVIDGFKGVKELSETDLALIAIVENFDRIKGHSNLPYCVLFYSKNDYEGKIEGPDFEKDIWFCWAKDKDFEPVKIVRTNSKATKALSRWHWMHLWINEPYCDEQGRIEVFLLPIFHTPIPRRKSIVGSAVFALFVQAFNAVIQGQIPEYNKDIDKYCWEKGLKASHKPKMNYPGWDLAKLKE